MYYYFYNAYYNVLDVLSVTFWQPLANNDKMFCTKTSLYKYSSFSTAQWNAFIIQYYNVFGILKNSAQVSLVLLAAQEV